MTSNFQLPRITWDDAHLAIGAQIVSQEDGFGHWLDEEHGSALFVCLGCGQFDALQLIPQVDGSIRAECLSDFACGKRKIERLLRDNWGLGLRRQNPAKARAKPVEGEQPDIWHANPVGDAWRLVQFHGSRLLLVQRMDGEYPDVYVLDTLTGIWSNDIAELALLHSEVSKGVAVEASIKMQEGTMSSARSMELQRWLRRTQSPGGTAEAAKMLLVAYRQMEAQGLVPVLGGVVRQDALDSDKRYLGCGNGVLDLDKGELVPVDEASGYLITRTTGVAYEVGLVHPAIEEMLEHLGDDEREFLLDAVAYSLRGNPAGTWYLIVGPGRNGKTTFLRAVAAALGRASMRGYAFSLSEGALLRDQNRSSNSHTEHLKHFPYSRLAYSSELPEGKNRFNVGLLKQLTGNDDLTLRGINQRSGLEQPATATIFQAMNPPDLERLDLKDEALESRTRILSWPAFPAGRVRDADRVNLVTTLEPAKAMLSKLVQRCMRLKQPPVMILSVADAVTAKRQESVGGVGEWLLERLEITADPGDFVVPDAIWSQLYVDMEGENGKVEGMDRRDVFALMRSILGSMPPQKNRRMRSTGVVQKVYEGVRFRVETADFRYCQCGAEIPLSEERELCEKCENPKMLE